jgi:hypothetical protein
LEFTVELTVDIHGKKKPKVNSVQEAAARTVQSAGDKRKDEDEDITAWLTDTDETVATGRDTVHLPIRPAVPQPSAKAPDPDAEPQADRPDPLANMNQPKPTAASSRSAASDMLKQFIHRQR